MGATFRPFHLLSFHKPFADDLIHRRLGHGCGDRLPMTIAISMPQRPFEAVQLVLDIDLARGPSRRSQAFRHVGHHRDPHRDMKPI
jgi:hypothetical protein